MCVCVCVYVCMCVCVCVCYRQPFVCSISLHQSKHTAFILVSVNGNETEIALIRGQFYTLATEADRLVQTCCHKMTLFTRRQTTSASHLMLNLQQGHNELESRNKKFHNVYKFVLTQQLLKSHDLLMQSGDVVVTGSRQRVIL